MNPIKGLIIKDLWQLKTYKKTLIVLIIIFIITSITPKSESGMEHILVIMITLGFGMFSMATFSYDEMAKADRYILTWPLTRKEVVRARYLFIISSTIIGSIAGIIISYMISFVTSQSMPNVQEILLLALGGILGIALVEAIQIPCVYKLGAEKGRIQMFMITIGIALLLGGFYSIHLPFHNLWYIGKNFLPILLMMAIIIIYGISYQLSYRIYLKKEV